MAGWTRTGDHGRTATELKPVATKYKRANVKVRIVKNKGAMRSSGKGWETDQRISTKRYYLEEWRL